MKKFQAAIASGNPAKINAVSAVLTEIGFTFDLLHEETDSGVSAQPFSLEETRLGAVNRAKQALNGGLDAAIGLEGGVYVLEGTLYLCNWGALITKEGALYTAAGAQIPLPSDIAAPLKEGMELGPVMDEYAQETGIRKHKGAVGILTAGLVNRDEMFQHIVKLLMGQYLRGAD
jgi:inosine/xanthosine triphosphatase